MKINGKYRIGFFLDEWIESDFKTIFDIRKACKDKNKILEFYEDYIKQIKEFLEENDDQE